ncbi:MAG: hypothetical protein OXL96_14045 [Candidatus Poribacteria bacterium]|nr:hypothetical protein [Candidatus Poribacteria bacterium]
MTDEKKIERYQSVSDQLAGAAAELQDLVDKADETDGADNRTQETDDAAGLIQQLASSAGLYLMRAKRLQVDAEK